MVSTLAPFAVILGVIALVWFGGKAVKKLSERRTVRREMKAVWKHVEQAMREPWLRHQAVKRVQKRRKK